MLKTMMELIENLGLDTSYYWQVKHIYGDSFLEAIYDREKSIWKMKPRQAEEWQSFSAAAESISFLEKSGYSIADFNRGLQSSLQIMAVHAHMVMKEVGAIIGEKELDTAIAEHQRFADELVSTIRRVMSKPEERPSSRLRLL